MRSHTLFHTLSKVPRARPVRHNTATRPNNRGPNQSARLDVTEPDPVEVFENEGGRTHGLDTSRRIGRNEKQLMESIESEDWRQHLEL